MSKNANAAPAPEASALDSPPCPMHELKAWHAVVRHAENPDAPRLHVIVFARSVRRAVAMLISRGLRATEADFAYRFARSPKKAVHECVLVRRDDGWTPDKNGRTPDKNHYQPAGQGGMEGYVFDGK